MRQQKLIIAIVMSLSAGFMSCGQSKEKSSDQKEEKAAIPGAMRETANFKIFVPEGWQFNEFSDGTVQTYNSSGSYMVEVKKAGYNMTDKDIEATLRSRTAPKSLVGLVECDRRRCQEWRSRSAGHIGSFLLPEIRSLTL